MSIFALIFSGLAIAMTLFSIAFACAATWFVEESARIRAGLPDRSLPWYVRLVNRLP